MKKYKKLDKKEYVDEEDVDMEPFLKEIDKEVQKEMAKYDSGSWLERIKFRWHFVKYYKNPLIGLAFTLFGRIKEKE